MQRRHFIALWGSAATAWPLSVLAEQGKVAKIDVLVLGYPDPSIFIMGLREGLRDLGYASRRSGQIIPRSQSRWTTSLCCMIANRTM
jgi:hypothetical protein